MSKEYYISGYSPSIQNIKVFLKQNDMREELGLVQFMEETGIRLNDAILLNDENIVNRQVFLIERKRYPALYEFFKGIPPMISIETEKMLISDEDGRFFKKSREYYANMIVKAAREEKKIRHYHIRRAYIEARRNKYWENKN